VRRAELPILGCLWRLVVKLEGVSPIRCYIDAINVGEVKPVLADERNRGPQRGPGIAAARNWLRRNDERLGWRLKISQKLGLIERVHTKHAQQTAVTIKDVVLLG